MKPPETNSLLGATAWGITLLTAALLKCVLFSYIHTQFSSVPWLIGLSGGHKGWIGRDPLPVSFAEGCFEQLWPGLGCPLFHDVHPAFLLLTTALPTSKVRCLEGWFWRDCHGMWHAQTMQVSVSWQLPEEVLVDPQRSWSCSAPSCWSCAPSRWYGETSLCTWFWKPGSFFPSQQAGSMFHSLTGGWKWQETCRVWTCLQSRRSSTARSCLVWPFALQFTKSQSTNL